MIDNQDRIRELVEVFGTKLTDERRARLDTVIAQRTRHFAMVLEDLTDPHNISAVVRSSEVFGLQDVHVIEELRPYLISKSVLKGSFKWLDILRYRSRATCLDTLRARGYRIAIASTHAETYLDDLNLSHPTAFYLGSEVLGNHPHTIEAADLRFKIRQYGLTESMNVSVCAGVLMSSLARWLELQGRARYALPPDEQDRLRRDFYERSVFGVERNSPVRWVE